jgi:hypothetical protein
MLQAEVVEKIKTHILYPATIFQKYNRLLDNAENATETDWPQMT